ncbi:hypothetical protein PHYSODRAFT_484616, partial [Phytophthora sojae]
FQIQHGEKYIQLKNYTDQLEAELRETKSKMQALTTSNDELRECKTLKAQPSARQFPSPTRSTMGMPQQDGGTLVTQASQFSRPSMRPIARPYAVDGSSSSMRNPMGNMGRPETPRTIQRPNVGMFDRRVISPDSATGRSKNPDRATENTAASFSAYWLPLEKKVPAKIVIPAPVQRNVPFDSDAILEAVVSDGLGSRSSHDTLTNLSLELADYEDLFNDSTSSPTDGGISALSPTDDKRQSRRKSADTLGFESDTESSGASIVLAPLKAPPQVSQEMSRTQRMRSAPRVAQRYQLRHPDQLIAEATERRRLTDEVLMPI